MDLVTLVSDPRVQALAAVVGAMALSSAHAYLDKHPRLQASLRVVAHFTGPLNLPAMKAAAIALCRAVVAAADKQAEDAEDSAAVQLARQEEGRVMLVQTVTGPDGSS